jgi:tRNA (guanosine-2'-O-)-methyltransferase
MKSERRLKKMENVLRHRQPDLTVVMENIHDPHNVSAVYRTCDAAGVSAVQLIYNSTKFPRIGKKSSASANKWVERREFRDVQTCYEKLHAEGFVVYATHCGENAVSLYETDLTKKAAIVIGNEHAGVSEEAAQHADVLLHIPMFGMIQSLNVSVATAVILFEAVRQRLAAGSPGQIKYSEEDLQKMLKEWALKR